MSQLDLFHFENDKPNFESLGHQNGFRFWYARDLMNMLGYADFSSFKKAINKAIAVCSTLDISCEENFQQVHRDIAGVNLPDYKLSKFACYLVAMNGDVKKAEVARAQAYFITIAEAFKRFVKEPDQVERVVIRGEVSEREKSLNSVAKEAGVSNFAYFQDKGYRGMYNMSLKDLKLHKGLSNEQALLDYMGKEELAANLFRITQTEAKIRNENIYGQQRVESAAYTVGRTVRNTMHQLSGSKPEDLPVDMDIKSVRSTIKSTHKEFVKLENKKEKS